MTAATPLAPDDLLRVPLADGPLTVARWGDGDVAVVAAHGLTSTHRFWSLVGPRVADVCTLLAPDLRGRGDSAALPGPYGMVRHADDLKTVLDHVGAGRAVVAGHSMGGAVAAVFATRHPDATRAVLLIDGGLTLGPPPTDEDVDGTIHAIVGPALDRLDRSFASADEYRAFWRSHPAFDGTGADPAHVDAYADHDLASPDGQGGSDGADGGWRPKADPDAVSADARDTLTNDDVRAAVERIDAPTTLLLAARGMRGEPRPLFPDELVADLRTARGPLRPVRVADTNHYTIGLARHGADAVARALRALIEVEH